jgi:hypothetical protein
MILAHHGAELPLVVATLAGAGTVAPLAVLVRARLAAAGDWLRRLTPRS